MPSLVVRPSHGASATTLPIPPKPPAHACHAVSRNYLCTWFLLDLAGSIPISTIALLASSGTASDDQQAVQAAKILKAPKLLRLGRIFKLLGKIDGARAWAPHVGHASCVP